MNTENPIAKEGFITKMKSKFNSKEISNIIPKPIRIELVGMNRTMDICAQACACCWDKEVPTGYDNVAEYVAKRSRTGHTSILEHSNYVVYMEIDELESSDIIEFMSTKNYLNSVVHKLSNGCYGVLLGGSLRGFADLYRETTDLNSSIMKAISYNLYLYSHSGAFEDICRLGLMNKDYFKNVEPDENFKLLGCDDKLIDTELFSVIGMDSIKKLYTNIYKESPEFASYLTTFDLIKFTTISILFKDMSRTCTHQLVRHRNAITQESQRYVDYSNACFNSPEKFKPEYDGTHKYSVRFGPSSVLNLTLSEIGNAMCGIYGLLNNPTIAGADYALKKEDARAFLPSNVQCKKIYMTFTYKNFLKFLQLREDPHAQAEIRKYATAVGDWFRANSEFTTKELCDLYTKPYLCIDDPFKQTLEEIHEEETTEDVVDVSEGDYIKAAGLEETENNTNNGEE